MPQNAPIMPDLEIRIGIKTDGPPLIKRTDGYTELKNMLIGDGFHWQKTISAKLPGKIELLGEDGLTIPYGDCFFDAENVLLINIVPLEKYLECVVGSEMNPLAPPEFLKAQAVVSRNWSLGKIVGSHAAGNEGFVNDPQTIIGWDDTSAHRGFHVCSDDHCQRYQGLQQVSKEAEDAIRTTENEILEDEEGHLIDTRFSKCCGGITEVFSTCWQENDYRSLKSFRDPWCDLSSLDESDRGTLLSSILKDYDLATRNYGFSWETEISKSDVRTNLRRKFGKDIGEIRSLEVLERGPSGRIRLLKINGTDSSISLGKELWIRRLLSPSHLYSSAFEIEDLGEGFRLHGKGWGHGVGLCQIGAAHMAYAGKDYKSILSFYYPDSRLRRL